MRAVRRGCLFLPGFPALLAAFLIVGAIRQTAWARTAPGWHIETVDPADSAGNHCSIDVDSSGLPQISYYESSNANLKFAKRTADTNGQLGWAVSNAASSGEVGTFSKIAIRGAETYFGYLRSSNNVLKYRKIDAAGALLGVQDIHLESDGESEIIVGGDGKAHFAFRRGSTLPLCQSGFTADADAFIHARETGYGELECYQVTSSSVSKGIALAAGKTSSQLFAVYFYGADAPGTTGANDTILRLRRSGPPDGTGKFTWPGAQNVWSIAVVTDQVVSSLKVVLAIDSSDNPHIVYQDPGTKGIMYVSRASETEPLTKTKIDSGTGAEKGPAIAVCPDNSVHVTYIDPANQRLKYATRPSGGGWTTSVLDEGTGGLAGQFSSIACDSQGFVHVAYSFQSNSADGDVNLKYATSRPICGDSIVATPETCDDGNSDDTDACRNNCTSATCGDGVVQAGVEPCDDGDSDDTNSCKNDCTLSPAPPTPVSCGNNTVDEGEQCDDGNQDDTDACAGCQVARCGDGFVQAGVEPCDDGNTSEDDDCNSQCQTALQPGEGEGDPAGGG